MSWIITKNLGLAPYTVADAQERSAQEYLRTHSQHDRNAVYQKRLISLVGIIAMTLGLILWTADAMYGEAVWRFSLSHYYYSPFSGDVFVIFLTVIGTSLLAFEADTNRERWLTNFAGLSIIGVAMIPTSGIGAELSESYDGRIFVKGANLALVELEGNATQLWDWSNKLHYAFAAISFSIMLWLTLAEFPKVALTDIKNQSTTADANGVALLHDEKITRNRIYRACAFAILISILCLLGYLWQQWSWWNIYRLSLICEVAALFFFGFAWLVKGRFFDLRMKSPGEITVSQAENLPLDTKP